MCWLHWVMRVARAHEGAWASFGSTPPVGGCRHFRGAVRSKRSGADPSGTRGGEDQPTSCRMKTHQQLPARKEPEPEPELDELNRRTDETSTAEAAVGVTLGAGKERLELQATLPRFEVCMQKSGCSGSQDRRTAKRTRHMVMPRPVCGPGPRTRSKGLRGTVLPDASR